MFKTISDTLYKTSNFKITLLMFGKESNLSKYKKNPIINVKRYQDNKDISIYLDTYSKTLLGFCTIPPQTTDEKNLHGESIYFSQRSFYDLDMALSVCLDWLKLKHYKYLYNISSDGKVKGLGESPPYYPSVYKNQSEFIRFIPAVVRDINGVLYEGIGIRSHRGALIQFTCMEFFTMASSVKNYIVNSYSNNLQLLKFGLDLALKIK